jgi:uncharacterized protein YfaS (alpha-2-macroglobulin family)
MRYLLLCCCLLMTTLLADSAAPGPNPPYAAQWRKIDALLQKDQTTTAAPLVEKLYQQAKRENNAQAYVRALLYQIRLLENKENDADEKAIALLESDLKTAQFPARPILHSLLAGLYAGYYNEHRYQLYERTNGAAPTTDQATPGAADGGTGLATWDASRLAAAIVRHYEQSVADEPARQLKTTLANLGDLATGGDAEGRALRPTLYDLLAQRAIAGLQNQELYITKPEQQWQPSEPQLFGSAQEFAALKFVAPVTDSLNGQLLALRLLQRLTAARLAAGNVAALADVDLQRLTYVRSLTEGTDLASQYEPALGRLAEQYKALPISAEFIAQQAEARHAANDDVAAVALTRTAEARFPKSRGATRARQLRAEIERPELAFSAADVVVPGQPWRLDLTTRNVTELHAWAYRITAKEWQRGVGFDGQDQTLAKRFARALKAAPAATWTVPVPTHPADYKEQKLAAAGAALPAGYYLILFSNKAALSTDPTAQTTPAGTITAWGVLGASQLSLVHRTNTSTGTTALLVLDRASGAPLAGVKNQATFNVYNRTTQRDDRRLGDVLPTGTTGEVELPGPNKANDALGREQLSSVRSWLGRDTLVTPLNSYYFPGRSEPTEAVQPRTFLFTDRAIYRPGQTLYFKGILTENQGAKSSLLTGQPVSLRLVDVNGQTAQTLTFTTSDFGSFHGSLMLPTGLLNGEMQLQTDNGSLTFAVEDYKRPTFLVTLDSVPGRPQFGQPLTINGRARAYAGQATDGASVNYRVTRRELWPLFDYSFGRGRGIMRPGPRGGSQEIAHGTTTTDAEGRFAFTFTPPLVPRQPSRRGWEPGYVFEITADVTDAAGETRTGTRNMVMGRNPLSLRLTGPDQADKQRLPTFTLLGTNATGEPLPATGTLRLLARRFRPSPPGVPGPGPETEADELPAELVKTLPFDTHASPALDLKAALASLPTGRYRLEARATGADSARASLDFTLYDSGAATVPYATPDWFVALGDTTAPGQPATVLLGSSEADTRVLLEVERGGQLLRREWLTLRAGEQRRLVLDSGPAEARGPLYIHTTQVRDNHLYRHEATVQVTEQPQPLQLSLATFRDRLQPGQRETWRLTIRQANGRPAEAELLATLYDQSLDIFRQHSFQGLEFGGNYFPARFGWQGNFGQLRSELLSSANTITQLSVSYPVLNIQYAGELMMSEFIRSLGSTASPEIYGSRAARGIVLQDRASGVRIRGYSAAAPAPMAMTKMAAADGMALGETVTVGYGSPKAPKASAPDLSTIAVRSDFRETALWEPALRTDKNGDVVLEFQMPEAVTRWQLLALAHDRQLHSGQLARQLVTQKEIQLTPNAPRFLRPGDAFMFPAKFSNLTDHATSGTAQLFLLDAATGQDITSQLLKGPAQLPVSTAAHQSQALGWPLTIPADFAPVAVTYKVVAQASREGQKPPKKTTRKQAAKNGQPETTYSDGEENTLPVLPNRVLITERLPLTVLGPGTREFELKKLTSTTSPTRRNQSLTLELTANPAWYAVQSLPYLLEYPYECSEQVFDRLYANLLAASILKQNPRFKTILAEWTRQAQGGTAAQQDALASKLAQNQDLKNLLLQETPWVRDAQSETERLARLSTLFDEARLAAETTRALAKLQAMQLPDGSWPWFERMPTDRYLTQVIVAGFGKLKTLRAFDASQDPTARPLLQAALGYLDRQLARDYATLRQTKGVKLEAAHLADEQVQALYARSYWPQPAVPAATRPALAYYQSQGAQHWLKRTRYLQAQLALALHRAGAKSAGSAAIMRALRENALHSPELGMYWKDVQPGYYWREAPTETQATLIEAFDEIANDQKAVDELKLWLLRQKQTHHWPSTRATADACYALLLRGTNWLATPTQPLQVTVGGQPLAPVPAQAGTGYLRTTWPAAAVQPALGRVSIQKADAGVAWGALYWQYFEDLDKVTPATTALSLERQLYREGRTAAGATLEKLTAAAPLRVGDVLVVRLVLRTDRALEYVHLKDQRAAGLELVNPLSGYQYQGGLGYYESPRDAATHFFLSEVPRGTHVFEYRLRAAQAGDFSGGLSEVQCLYAPEFGATSAGQRLSIGKQP